MCAAADVVAKPRLFQTLLDRATKHSVDPEELRQVDYVIRDKILAAAALPAQFTKADAENLKTQWLANFKETMHALTWMSRQSNLP